MREREGGREAYGFLIDADWLLCVDVEHLLDALRILKSDKSKAPAINFNKKRMITHIYTHTHTLPNSAHFTASQPIRLL